MNSSRRLQRPLQPRIRRGRTGNMVFHHVSTTTSAPTTSRASNKSGKVESMVRR